MKNLLKNLMVLAILFSLASCTNETLVTEDPAAIAEQQSSTFSCAAQQPQARLTNNNTVNANFEIFDENGALLGAAYNVTPGQVSSWKSFSPGVIEFRVSTTTPLKTIVLDMDYCMGYDLALDSNNQLNTDVPTNY